MESDLNRVRGKLMGLAGTHLEDEVVTKLLGELLDNGGGVLIELDAMNFKLLRRDGRFVLVRDPRKPPSTVPPRR